MNNIDCIYILNLKKERSRLKQTLMLLADEEIYIPIKIFKGIYWNSDYFKKIKNKIIFPSQLWEEKNGDTLKIGQLSCCYSHINLLKDAYKNKYNNILLLQDDVYCENIGELKYEIDKYHNLIKKYNDFDLYYLGRLKMTNENEEKFKDTDFLVPKYSWNAHSVIFSRNCIEKLLNTQICNNIIPFDEFLPLCYGYSECKNHNYYSNLFPKIINAVSSDTYTKIYQVTYESSRYKKFIDQYSLTDISNSNFI